MHKFLLASMISMLTTFSLSAWGNHSRDGRNSSKNVADLDYDQITATPQSSIAKNEESKPVPQAAEERNVHGDWEGKSAPHTCSHSWFLDAEFLYWKAMEESLDYALDIKSKSDLMFVDTTVRDPKFKWRPGFRAGVGYIFGNHDAWDLSATYTYMTGYAHDSVGVADLEPEHAFVARWFPFVLGPFAQNAEATWKLHFNVVDLALGRDYFISKNIALHPFLGVRGAFIYQHYRADYLAAFRISNGGNTTFMLGKTKFIADNDFKAGGIRAGTDFLWHWTSHWGLFGGLGASALYGRFHVLEQFFGLSVSGNNGVNELVPRQGPARHNFNTTRINIDGSIGIYWETMFKKCKSHLLISLGYEISHWFKQNMLREITQVFDVQPVAVGNLTDIVITNNTLNGDLGLQGGTLKFRYDF